MGQSYSASYCNFNAITVHLELLILINKVDRSCYYLVLFYIFTCLKVYFVSFISTNWQFPKRKNRE